VAPVTVEGVEADFTFDVVYVCVGRAIAFNVFALAGWLPFGEAYERDLAHNARWTLRGEILLLLATVRAVLARPR
jgi:hypothetical protein